MFMCVCVCVGTVCKLHLRRGVVSLSSLLAVFMVPPDKLVQRGLKNGAGGSGISSHCHDNDSDTLTPSDSGRPLYGNRNVISPAALRDNPL